MERLSTRDKNFLEAVHNIFAAPEVLVVVRYVYGAGARDFLILKDVSDFHNLLSGLRPRDSVVVMKSFGKIMEGTVDQSFIAAAVAAYTKNSCWILIRRGDVRDERGFGYGGSSGEIREELEDWAGKPVCIVDEPNYLSAEHSIGAYVPDDDGVVRPGAY